MRRTVRMCSQTEGWAYIATSARLGSSVCRCYIGSKLSARLSIAVRCDALPRLALRVVEDSTTCSPCRPAIHPFFLPAFSVEQHQPQQQPANEVGWWRERQLWCRAVVEVVARLACAMSGKQQRDDAGTRTVSPTRYFVLLLTTVLAHCVLTAA